MKPASIETMETAAPADSGFCVYLGPSIPGVIQAGTLFGVSRTEAVRDLAPVTERYPLIPSLIVTGEELPAARIKIKTPGNLLYENYRRMRKGEKKEDKPL